MIKTNCSYCNKEILKYKYQINSNTRLYCNSICACIDLKPAYKGGKIKKICKICKSKFYVFPKDKKQKYCSSKCYGFSLKGKIGKDSVRWKGAIYYQQERKSIKYYEWRDSVFKRDNYNCQRCDEKGGALNAHHLLPYSEYEELRFDISNGATLCKECHKKFHKKYGKEHFNNYDFYEFIDLWQTM